MRYKVQIFLVGVIFISLFLCSCSNESSYTYVDSKKSTIIIINPDLEKRVLEYYNYEKKKDWENTYLFRTPLYRGTVSKDTYVKNMVEDSKDGMLKEFNILDAKEENDIGVIKIEFIQQFPKNYFSLPKWFPRRDRANTRRLIEVSIWEKIDDTWYCRNACVRLHLSLNADLVVGENQKPINITFE